MAPLCQPAPGQPPDLSIPQYFARLQDPRRAHRRLHLLSDILVIALCFGLYRGLPLAFVMMGFGFAMWITEMDINTREQESARRAFNRVKW